MMGDVLAASSPSETRLTLGNSNSLINWKLKVVGSLASSDLIKNGKRFLKDPHSCCDVALKFLRLKIGFESNTTRIHSFPKLN